MPNTNLSITDLENVTGGINARTSSSSVIGNPLLGAGATGGVLPLLLAQQQQQAALLAHNNDNNMLPLVCCMIAMNKQSRPAFFSQGPFGYSWQA